MLGLKFVSQKMELFANTILCFLTDFFSFRKLKLIIVSGIAVCSHVPYLRHVGGICAKCHKSSSQPFSIIIWGFTRFIKVVHVRAAPHPQGSAPGLQCAFYSGSLPAGLFPEPGLAPILNGWNHSCFDISCFWFDAQPGQGLAAERRLYGCVSLAVPPAASFMPFDPLGLSLWDVMLPDGKYRLRKAGAPTQ